LIPAPSIEAPGATPEELAAIVAAVTIALACRRGPVHRHPELVEGRPQPVPWALAARYPDAEFDELRAIVCSTRS
jgi:hypothetical protein